MEKIKLILGVGLLGLLLSGCNNSSQKEQTNPPEECNHFYEWIEEVNEHYQHCINCGDVKNRGVHVFDGERDYGYISDHLDYDEGHYYEMKCSVCEYRKDFYEPHQFNHDNDYIYQESTFEREGILACECELCHRKVRIGDMPRKKHNYSNSFSSDETYHWRICTDEGYDHLYTDKESHCWGEWQTLNEPTYEEVGTKMRSCTKCGRQEWGTIPNGIETTAKNFFYLKLETDGSYTINGSHGTYPYEECIIPSHIDSHPVKSVLYFGLSDNIKKLILPETISSIKIGSFSTFGDQLESISVNSNNPYYSSKDGILYNKNQTELIFIPINYVHPLSGKTELILPDSLTTIKAKAFYAWTRNYRKTISIKFNSNINKIESDQIESSYGYSPTTNFYLKNKFPNGIENLYSINNINNVYFQQELFLKVQKSIYDVRTNEDLHYTNFSAYLIDDDGNSVDRLVVPDTATNIDYLCFFVCKEIFVGKNVQIPSTQICSEMCERVDVDPDNPYLSSIDGIVYDKDITTLIEYPQSKKDYYYDMPDSVTSVGREQVNSQLSLNKYIVSIKFSSLLAKIYSSNVPSRCVEFIYRGNGNISQISTDDLRQLLVIHSGDRKVYVDSNNIYIDHKSKKYFVGAIDKDITVLNIPSTVDIIHNYSCSGFINLESVNIPDGVTSIGDYAFSRCSKLSSMYFNGTTEQWNSVKKGYSWNYGIKALVVHCSDGDANL